MPATLPEPYVRPDLHDPPFESLDVVARAAGDFLVVEARRGDA